MASKFNKAERYVKQGDEYKLLSYATSSESVEMSDGTDLQTKMDNVDTKVDTKVDSVKIGTTEYKSGTTVTLPVYTTDEADSTFGADIGLSIDTTTYKMTLVLKDNNGTTLSSKTIDFPIESMVVNASYTNGTLTLTLQNGTTLDVDISSIISGLVPETRTIAGVDLKENITATELRTALNVASGAEVNQNAFSNVKVGDSTIAADSKTDTLTLVAGDNVTITPDTTNDKVTIASSHPTISKSTNSTSTASPNSGGTFTAIDSITQDSNGHVTKINTKTVTLPSTSITVDSALSSTSTNPVQNKVINTALADKASSAHTHKDSDLTISDRRVAYRNLSHISGVTTNSTLTEVVTAMDAYSSVTFWNNGTSYPNIHSELMEGLSSFGFDTLYGLVEIRKTSTTAIVEWQNYTTTKYLYRCVYSTTNDVGWSDWSRCLISSDIVTMTGASSSAAGTKGYVPAPAAGYQYRYLRGDGSWIALSSSLTSTSTASALNLAGAKALNDAISSVDGTASEALSTAESAQEKATINLQSIQDIQTAWDSDLTGSYVIDSIQTVTVSSSSTVAANGTATVTGTFTTVSGIDNYKAVPITFGYAVPTSISASGGTLTVKLLNISGATHTLSCSFLVFKLRTVPSY